MVVPVYEVVTFVEGCSGSNPKHQGLFTDKEVASRTADVVRKSFHGKTVIIERVVNIHSYFVMNGMKPFMIETRDGEESKSIRMSPWDKIPDKEIVLIDSYDFWTRDGDKMITGKHRTWMVWATDEEDAIRKVEGKLAEGGSDGMGKE